MTPSTAFALGVLIALIVSPTILTTLAGRAWVRQQEDRVTIAGRADDMPVQTVQAGDIDAWTRDRLAQLARERHQTTKEMYG